MYMNEYEGVRQVYKPRTIKFLMIAESPPPKASNPSSRHFYRTDKTRRDDRLFTNTIKALYPEAADLAESEIQSKKEEWLRCFQADGWYMIEALDTSLPHGKSPKERQSLISESLPRLIDKVQRLATKGTKLILIKSNVFIAATEPLRAAGFEVLNHELLDYPGRFNQRAYREKLAALAQSR